MPSILENSLERGLENNIERKENPENNIENKSGAGSDKTFWIVVESLAEQGHPLPNDDIYEIKKSTFGKIEAIILKFSTDVTLMFSYEGAELLAIIKGEGYKVEEKEAQTYRSKYYDYALLFLQEEKEILKKRSHLAKVRLDRIGI
jgi:hypothetical protein